MTAEQFQPIPDKAEAALREERIMHAGEELAKHDRLLLDMDGVELKPHALRFPSLTSFDLISSLRALEQQGVKLGPATGRGIQVVNFLRHHGLQVTGPGIFEEGSVYVQNGEIHELGHQDHPALMETVKHKLESLHECVPTWDHVLQKEREGKFAFSPGNFQWQGIRRSSFWFHYNDDLARDNHIKERLFEPIIREAVAYHAKNAINPEDRLDYDRDVELSMYRMQAHDLNGNVAIVGIKGKLNGERIHKGTAAALFPGSWGFVADGQGDNELADVTHDRNGVVIGIGGNPDLTPDAPKFLKKANVVLRDPTELALAIRHTANLRQRRAHF